MQSENIVLKFSWDLNSQNPSCSSSSEGTEKYSFSNKWCSRCSPQAKLTQRGICEFTLDPKFLVYFSKNISGQLSSEIPTEKRDEHNFGLIITAVIIFFLVLFFLCALYCLSSDDKRSFPVVEVENRDITIDFGNVYRNNPRRANSTKRLPRRDSGSDLQSPEPESTERQLIRSNQFDRKFEADCSEEIRRDMKARPHLEPRTTIGPRTETHPDLKEQKNSVNHKESEKGSEIDHEDLALIGKLWLKNQALEKRIRDMEIEMKKKNEEVEKGRQAMKIMRGAIQEAMPVKPVSQYNIQEGESPLQIDIIGIDLSRGS